MICRKALYVILIYSFCLGQSYSSDIDQDFPWPIERSVRINHLYTSIDPQSLACMTLVSKAFHNDLSVPPFGLKAIYREGFKWALSQLPEEFNQNLECRDLVTCYRAYIRFKNWSKGLSEYNMCSKFPKNNFNYNQRICHLPMTPAVDLDPTEKGEILRLVIDKYHEVEWLWYSRPSAHTNYLMQTAKSLVNVRFSKCKMTIAQWKEAFDSIASHQQVTDLVFEKCTITEEVIHSLLNTDQSWRNKVRYIKLIEPANNYKISSQMFHNILIAFQNIESFKSSGGCNLAEPFVIKSSFQMHNKLSLLEFSFDKLSKGFLTDIGTNLSLMLQLKNLNISYSNLEDKSVHILLWIKKQRPTLELDCFRKNTFSVDAIQQAVQFFNELDSKYIYKSEQIIEPAPQVQNKKSSPKASANIRSAENALTIINAMQNISNLIMVILQLLI